MKTESYLFAGVALFFAAAASVYGWFAREPAGKAALVVAFLMSALVAFFFRTQYSRRGVRPQDTTDAEVVTGAGPLEFFAPRSYYPLLTAAGVALAGLGLVYALWLFVIGMGVTGAGVLGFVFQYAQRGQ
ncbi:cytochrome c oxidase subunit IV [Streptomyces sp. 1114.5]|uniref:aa3-type cytochrome oxidase subunit IV n=1 Tax=unclassified Streptomyces TaxID=2593676 RepID=UPI000BC4C264|nr:MULTISPECIES: cytochrome c oxidase subunit 4 [unclassified Streptomyces]RKT09448.1 cytochrome c oxidase subunit IV [Streptomyces sp. 1114.5]SOB88547.1 Cytochrome c oxidase subunit IV [Streptomyces sp. 1331.2]